MNSLSAHTEIWDFSQILNNGFHEIEKLNWDTIKQR